MIISKQIANAEEKMKTNSKMAFTEQQICKITTQKYFNTEYIETKEKNLHTSAVDGIQVKPPWSV